MIEETEEQKKLLDEAAALKEEGNSLFTSHKFHEALEVYHKVIAKLPIPDFLKETDEEDYDPYAEETGLDPDDEDPNRTEEEQEPEKKPQKTEAEYKEPIRMTSLRADTLNNMSLCHIKLEQYEDAIGFATMVLKHPTYERSWKALYRRAVAEEKTNKLDEALADMKEVVELEPRCQDARRAIPRLEKAAAEKHEKEKKELIDKLKGIGNTLLGKIGLSLDNFKMQKDEKTGGYNIQFQK